MQSTLPTDPTILAHYHQLPDARDASSPTSCRSSSVWRVVIYGAALGAACAVVSASVLLLPQASQFEQHGATHHADVFNFLGLLTGNNHSSTTLRNAKAHIFLQQHAVSTTLAESNSSFQVIVHNHLKLITTLVLLVICSLLFHPLVNAMVKYRIESLEQVVLSVDVHIDQVSVNVLRRSIVINGLIVDNPPGFQTEYLLKIRQLKVAIHLFKFICSLGRKVELKDLYIDKLDVICEVPDFNARSNIQVIQAFVDGGTKEPYDKTSRARRREYIVHKVLAEHILVQVRVPSGKIEMNPCRIEKIEYEDFASTSGLKLADDIMRHCVGILLRKASLAAVDVTELALKCLTNAKGQNAISADDGNVEEAKKRVHEAGLEFTKLHQDATASFTEHYRVSKSIRGLLKKSNPNFTEEDEQASSSGEEETDDTAGMDLYAETHVEFHEHFEVIAALEVVRRDVRYAGLRASAICPSTGFTKRHLAVLVKIIGEKGVTPKLLNSMFRHLSHGRRRIDLSHIEEWLGSS